LIAIAAVIAAWWLLCAAGHRPELLGATLGGVASFAYFIYRQHVDETKLFKALFLEFNARYDALNDDLNAILFGPTEGLLSAAEREKLFSYFNLCAEEYLFYKAGYIDCRVWESWCRGMGVFFKHPRIQALWEQDCKAESYYGFRPPE
jgi:hypothetical protein